MPTTSEHIVRILREGRDRLTAADIAGRLNAEFGKVTGPYSQGEIEGELKKLVADGKLARIEDDPPTYTAIRAKTVKCPKGHDMLIVFLLGTPEVVQAVKCPTCDTPTSVVAGQLIRQDQ